MGEVLPDVDDHGQVGLREGDEQPPRSPEMDDTQPVDAFAGESVASGVAPDFLQALDRRDEGRLDPAPEPTRGLAAQWRPADSKALGLAQRSALETSS